MDRWCSGRELDIRRGVPWVGALRSSEESGRVGIHLLNMCPIILSSIPARLGYD